MLMGPTTDINNFVAIYFSACHEIESKIKNPI
jgi:hypothetical protein